MELVQIKLVIKIAFIISNHIKVNVYYIQCKIYFLDKRPCREREISGGHGGRTIGTQVQLGWMPLDS